MAGAREIRSKIRSTQNMRKVTSALQMVSASKVRRAQERMLASRPYARLMRRVIAHVARADGEVSHPFLETRETVQRVGYIVVSSDRGLCGGLNANLFRRLLAEIRDWRSQGVAVEVLAIGQKAQAFFRRLSELKLAGSVIHLGDAPKLEDLIGGARLMLKAYEEGQLQRLSLVYNRFVNAMQQQPSIESLLPLAPQADAEAERELPAHAWDYLYEPEAEQVLPRLLTRYLESQIYQGVVENIASEHAARMVAMKAASDNAKKVIDSLTLSYNKARQAAITQEISEIVGGASVV